MFPRIVITSNIFMVNHRYVGSIVSVLNSNNEIDYWYFKYHLKIIMTAKTREELLYKIVSEVFQACSLKSN